MCSSDLVIIGFGFLDAQQQDKNIPLDNPASVETALKVANEAIVLLKNEIGRASCRERV